METIFDSQRLSDEYLCVNSCGTEIALNRDIPTNRPVGRVDYHILYIEKGVCTIWVDGKSRDVPQGNIILFPPEQPQHYCLRARENSVSAYIHFTGTGCQKLMDFFLAQKEQVFYVGKSATCDMLFQRMAQEMIFKSELYEEICAAYLHQLLVLLQRKARSFLENTQPQREKRIGSICLKMQREFHLDIPMEQYAAECCLSRSRFAHLFTQQVGRAPGVYRNELRLEHAKELLLMTELPIGEIGALVGFQNPNYFSRLFTSAVGCTPSSYRKRS